MNQHKRDAFTMVEHVISEKLNIPEINETTVLTMSELIEVKERILKDAMDLIDFRQSHYAGIPTTVFEWMIKCDAQRAKYGVHIIDNIIRSSDNCSGVEILRSLNDFYRAEIPTIQ